MSLIPSPCTGICALDPATGWCRGCARTADEITAWPGLRPPAQAAIWADLPDRRAILRMPFELLPWTGASLLRRLAESGRSFACSMGTTGAVAEFVPDDATRLEMQDDRLGARATDGALLLEDRPGMRAFAVSLESGAEAVVLALHRARLKVVHPDCVTRLGPDDMALMPGENDCELIDLGLGRRTCRFCVRTKEPHLLEEASLAAGRQWQDKTHRLVPLLLAASPTRVLLGPFGRIEVKGPIGRQGVGSRTHLLPPLLERGQDLGPGSGLPPDYIALAILHGGPNTLLPPCNTRALLSV
ncbi:Protein of unknown function [Arboricoccus pini]|uniref:DUF1289 domain-containing protein n=1 Tax=Arboricoccus pini TaxID=1963835 RepID=A0A212QQA8_9PROT|nr:DUF1289 domain-containing protein [Arboricoccus pini]SNB61662.1 Protein of unknown function [Arboricoccus pini]